MDWAGISIKLYGGSTLPGDMARAGKTLLSRWMDWLCWQGYQGLGWVGGVWKTLALGPPNRWRGGGGINGIWWGQTLIEEVQLMSTPQHLPYPPPPTHPHTPYVPQGKVLNIPVKKPLKQNIPPPFGHPPPPYTPTARRINSVCLVQDRNIKIYIS